MNALVLISVICTIALSHAEEEPNPCEDQPNGYKLIVPGTCSDFHICLNKRSIKQSCGTMYFNSKTHACDLPHRVDCIRTVVLPQPQEVHICDGLQNGGLIASTENCTDYYVCVGKMAIPRTCGWMHFSLTIGKCVQPRYSNCDRQKKMAKSRPVIKYEEAGRAVQVPVLLMPRT